MKIKKYRLYQFLILVLLSIIFTSWILYKYFPLNKNKQDAKIERQRLRFVQEFDRITPAELEGLPKFDSYKYVLIKRNSRFWLVPREYYSDNGFYIRWPDTVNNLLEKEWKNETNKKNPVIRVFMESRQFNSKTGYAGNDDFLNKEPCIKKNDWFIWNGINIRLYPLDVPNLMDDQYLDICITSLKILNEKIKEIYYVN